MNYQTIKAFQQCNKNINTMDNMKEKRSYHFNVTEVIDGKIQEVMNFNLGGHHDLAALAKHTGEKHGLCEKHADQLVLGMRLLHHALKKNIQNSEFAAFLYKLNEFKHYLKGSDDNCDCKDNCDCIEESNVSGCGCNK